MILILGLMGPGSAVSEKCLRRLGLTLEPAYLQVFSGYWPPACKARALPTELTARRSDLAHLDPRST